MSQESINHLSESARFIQARAGDLTPKIGIILGSGLGFFAEELEDPVKIPTREIPHYPCSTVEGHKGCLVLGYLNGIPVGAVQGRVHFYEGYSMAQVAYPVGLLHQIGITDLIITNAAGGINPDFIPGDLMIIEDQINLMFGNPLVGPHHPQWGPRFPDMSDAFHRPYVQLAQRVAEELNIPVKKGVLCGLTGPSYETAAEVRMMAFLGADAGCMSTVPEVIAAARLGIRVLGISCITNLATGISDRPLEHQEVTETARRVQGKFGALARVIIRRMAGILSY